MVFGRQMVAKWTSVLSEVQAIWDAVNAAANSQRKAFHFEHMI